VKSLLQYFGKQLSLVIPVVRIPRIYTYLSLACFMHRQKSI
jgi:hypothetical protein